MQIEMRDVSELAPYARNARTHPEWQVAQIEAAIRRFGFTNPLLIDVNGIVAGHGRVMAAERIYAAGDTIRLPGKQELAFGELPTIDCTGWSDEERRAYIIADNKIAENAGWDEELLRQELAVLRDEAFDLDVIGFSETELEELLGSLGDEGEAPALGEPDHVPESKPRPVSRRGDVWLLGEHRAMCGDSTSKADMAALCGSELVDACWTDPPYNVNYEGSAGKIQNDNMGSGEFRRFLVEAFGAAASVMKKGAPIYVAHADTEGQNFRAAFKDAGFKLSGCLIWVKPSLVLGRSDYQWRHEPVLYGWKAGGPHKWYGGRANTTVIEEQRPPVRIMPDGTVQIDIGGQVVAISGEKLAVETLDQTVLRADKPVRNVDHPTMKPVGLILGMLENSTKRGDLVLDPFGGSGSTLIACHGAGRSARLMELDEKFADVIVRRWQEYTSLVARRESDGLTFEAAEADREAA